MSHKKVGDFLSKHKREKIKEKLKMSDIKMPHPEHEKHLCYLHNLGYVKSNFNDYKHLVQNPKFVCKGCGRVAASEKNLCTPEKL